jgi:hypothetical protein
VDLLERGRWLISESVNAGVTAMRAFVEVDSTVRFKCLNAAVQLKREFEGYCYLQICAYAQDPIFSTENSEANRALMEEAAKRSEVEVVGTTPYVEVTEEDGRRNVDWAVKTAMEGELMLDLHLDYNLDGRKEAMVHYLMRRLEEVEWVEKQERGKRSVLLGHCTRLTLLTHRQWRALVEEIERAGLRDCITFVGLPTSDTYMQGRPPSTPSEEDRPGARPRATLIVPQLIKEYGLNAVIGINNVGNMYTPHGGCDPLALISSCVGLYQAGTVEDTKLLFECVSGRAKKAMGLPVKEVGEDGWVDGEASWILIPGEEEERQGVEGDGRKGDNSILGVRKRPRLRLFGVVLDPPSVKERRVVYKGRLIK